MILKFSDIMSKQTEEDFKKHLGEQIGFLSRSASAYDEGYESEAKRMAIVLRVLLYDNGNRSVSLLTHLNKKEILFYDTARDLDPLNILAESTLTYMMMTIGESEQCKYLPILDEPQISIADKKVSFEEWWNKNIIKDMQGNTFSRGKLINSVCNKDGGAHIDAKLNENYANLTRNNSFGITYELKNSSGPIPGVELASIRQITHEVLKSLKDEFQEYFD